MVATYDGGGAGTATLRLMDALRTCDVEATMLTYYRRSGRGDVQRVLQHTDGLESLWMRLMMRYALRKSEQYRVTHDNAMWSHNRLPNPLYTILNRHPVDLLHFHWVGIDLLPIASLSRLTKPVVWTLHDMWALTGGCHYARGCDRYQTHCGCCPLLPSEKERDVSYRNFAHKLAHWRGLMWEIVTPSRWLADCARQSPFLHDKSISVIPNALDTDLFQPLNRDFARRALHLPPDKKLVLFGAGHIHNESKGLILLLEALAKLPDGHDIELVVFGQGDLEQIDVPVPLHHAGSIGDERLLTLLYNAADVLVAPSYQEAFGQVVTECMACGTPAVAFNATGVIDIIDHYQNGYLASAYDVDDLAAGIAWVLNHPEPGQLSGNAREKVLSHFSMDVVAKQYIALYERVLAQSAATGEEV